MARKSGLGKGLDALIPGDETAPSGAGAILVRADAVQFNPRQPRTILDGAEMDGLVDSIRTHGILQPLLITQGRQPNEYTLIAGERRLRAARLAGLEFVPALVRLVTPEEQLELALIENIQRADLTPLEAAEAFRQLEEEFGLTHEEIAHKVGKSRQSITNTLRLLKLPEALRSSLAEKRISEGHARALLGLPTTQSQIAGLQTVLRLELNVRQTEALVRRETEEASKAAQTVHPSSPEIQAIEKRLFDQLGTRVAIHHGKKGGRLVIYYYSDEELDSLINQITKD